MRAQIFVLNYNGRALLAEYLPSIVAAAQASRHEVEVSVVDNASSDDSRAYVAQHGPAVRWIACANRGLCSFNQVVAQSDCQAAILLNNDVRLAPDCLDPWLAPLDLAQGGDPHCFMTAPRCYLPDGATYEGLKTSIRWRYGLVQATARFPGHPRAHELPGLTASAGCALAVERSKFLELGGFDPLFLPGRLEDLDFAFRGYMAGYRAHYVPAAITYHRGQATFGAVYGPQGCDALALRNTLLFQWKNLRHPLHWLYQATGLPLRLARDWCTAPFRPRAQRLSFSRALLAALARSRQIQDGAALTSGDVQSATSQSTASQPTSSRPGADRSAARWPKRTPRLERDYFRQFHPRQMASAGSAGAP